MKILLMNIYHRHLACPPEDFLLCQWQKTNEVNAFYLLYRFIFSCIILMHVSVFVNSTLYIPLPVKLTIFAYVTNWSIGMCIVVSLLGLFIVSYSFVIQEETGKVPPLSNNKLFLLYWLIHRIGSDAVIAIAITYNVYVIFVSLEMARPGGIYIHIFIAIIMIIDGQVVRMRVYLCHIVLSIIYGVIYSIFMAIYLLCGGRGVTEQDFLYPGMNWKKNPIFSMCASLCGITCLGSATFISFGLYKWRCYLHRRISYKTSL